MDPEENLSDASLIEDDDEEVFDLPDENMELDSSQMSEDEDFHGFEPQNLELPSQEESTLDLNWPFPKDMNHCISWYVGQLPSYKVHYANGDEPELKVKPLKIKKASISGNFSTPSPMLQRESREWKPSSQFFKPLSLGWVREVIYERNEDGNLCSKAKEVVYHAPVQPGSKARTFKSQAELRHFLGTATTLTLHNFSFRQDPLNAPKGQEIIRAVDENVEIFPKPPTPPPPKAAKNSTPTSSLTSSGLLKVKMFGKMKEKNAFDSDKNQDDEDFDLVSDKTQSLGNSGVTITPINKQKRNVHLPAQMKKRPILRPPISANITCSIHCTNASGFPNLSCVSCQSLYHPVCVGLSPTNDYSSYDFYCSTCQPPSGKENKPAFTLGNSSTTITSALTSTTKATKAMPSVTLTPTGNKSGKKRNNLGKPVAPLRPIEAQSVVNINGMKYLVVPHPDPSVKSGSKKKEGKLPIVLKPATQSEYPSFEVEEDSNGKLTLLPLGGNNRKILPVKNPVMKDFQQVLSSGFTAMHQVFKYLNTKDRISAGQVCKFWYQISKSSNLWNSVSLKNCRVADWKLLRDQLNKNGTKNLDMRRMHFAQDQKETWKSCAENFMFALISLESLDLPKMSPEAIHNIVESANNSPITNLKCLKANQITFLEQELNFDLISGLENLVELRLKSVSGELKIQDFPESFQKLAKMTNLKTLGLLSLEKFEIQHLEIITENLTDLEHLVLGSCESIEPENLFQSLKKLTKLKTLRLEKGKFDVNIQLLGELENLETLELIDFEMALGFGPGLVKLQNVRKLLLIPVYTDEVAAINAEAVDAFLSLSQLTHFYLGLKIEWLEQVMGSLFQTEKEAPKSKYIFPILINGVCEWYTLNKLYKTILTALPNAQKLKILTMPTSATKKQYISNLIK